MMDWRRDGACWDTDPWIFFSTSEEDEAVALTYCAACPVVDQCLDHALRIEIHGVWGGTTASERKRMRRDGHIKVEQGSVMSRTRRRPPETVALSKAV